MINIYFINNPLYINRAQQFTVGYINNATGELINITNSCTIEILQPQLGVAIVGGNLILINSAKQNISVQFKITYNSETDYLYFAFVQPIEYITEDQLYNTFNRYLPLNVYSNNENAICVYDNLSNIKTLYNIFNNNDINIPSFTALNNVLEYIYPISGYQGWENYLNGTNNFLTNSFDYNSLLQLYYQTAINNDTNPYYLALNISKFIYYRWGINKYVYIGENVTNYLSGFILNGNKLGEDVLLGNINGATPTKAVIYIIDGTAFTVTQQTEIYNFSLRIMRASLLIDVVYNQTFTDLNLTPINTLPDNYTYHKDPRQENTYCIEFDKNTLAEAKGYTGGVNFADLTDFNLYLNGILIPTTGTYNLTALTDYTLTIEGIWSLPITPTINLVNYAEEFSSDTNVLSFSYSSGIQLLKANNTGTVTIHVYCYTFFHTYTFLVS